MLQSQNSGNRKSYYLVKAGRSVSKRTWCQITRKNYSILLLKFYNNSRDICLIDINSLKIPRVQLLNQDLRISNMRVKYACQVMSHTVAVGFETLISLETLPTTAQGTVDFINSMDKLFNLFNSRSSVSEQPEKSPYTMHKCTPFIKFLAAHMIIDNLRNVQHNIDNDIIKSELLELFLNIF
ncbi:hypothetical protein AGLY_014382 [Aphis glycines]|uniref:Transposable element P transposase-like GTP-binding insertion domain-containing protein n=1 Tax=Aphis glycines TaxID=307491 RepID=A0A6G0T5M5_APHGL|nr:hypothetical protein AGLY_014382 [Aphis glycines]